MGPDLIAILSETILPLAERLDRDHLILPGAAGKNSIGTYPSPAHEHDIEKGLNIEDARVGTYGSHPQGIEWVIGLSGKAELALDGRRYEIAVGDFAIIPRHAMHLERIRDHRHGFHLIWVACYLNKDRVTMHSSSYFGGNRFQLVRGAAIEKCRDLCQHFQTVEHEATEQAPGWESLIRATIVTALIRALRRLKEEGLGLMPKEYPRNVVEVAKSYIQAHFSRHLTLNEIAHAVFLSPTYFSSLFAQTAGFTVFDYVHQVRLDEAKRLLKETKIPINEVASKSGFRTRSHFVRSFRSHTGRAPREFRIHSKAES
jgi:AraC-like DNA-binding protein